MNGITGNKRWKVVPILLMALAAAFIFACDPGGDGGDPTGADSLYNPQLDERSGMTLTLRPSTIAVGTTTATVSVTAQLLAPPLQAATVPLEGVPVVFSIEPYGHVQADGFMGFYANPSYTDVNGLASTTLFVVPGTPSGSYTVRARSSFGFEGPLATDFRTLIVNATPLSALAITTASLDDGTDGVAYADIVSAVGGTGPGSYTWSLDGTLPAGLSFASSPVDGLLSGTPSETGTFTFIITVTDGSGNTASRTFTITIS